MRRLIILLVALWCFNVTGFTQQLPLNTCGIVNVYDAAGNRTKRTFFCNNGSPYPTKVAATDAPTMEFQPVDALYPNPTSGKFSVTFSKALKNAAISLTDEQGRVVKSFKASGNRLDFDVSALAGGIYYVRVEEGGNVITKKVVKQ
jgi:hypothetical protein